MWSIFVLWIETRVQGLSLALESQAVVDRVKEMQRRGGILYVPDRVSMDALYCQTCSPGQHCSKCSDYQWECITYRSPYRGHWSVRVNGSLYQYESPYDLMWSDGQWKTV